MRLIKHVFVIGIFILSIITHAQEKQTIMANENIITTFLNGFDDTSKITESLSLLADDYQFTSPTDALYSKIEFIEEAKNVAKVLTGLKINKIAVSGNWVAANYTFMSAIKGLENTTANEWFRVENGKIKESHLIYDASEWRKVFESVKQ
ncbi:nuclear transport factor 2 family protein [Hyunsoonleella pacifica]|uniref:Nuclear transport factor 2 family protein n=1 Tax=Hyunsoonleella pacifica TaxID=1080224 RepID=A0A4V2JBA9_9FLAO|nr:nuclear transport factor 2 family protein [Hyunsoonleella pacifica]TBN18541.1 nuclear transport factor 2 family protein [Hyunsoonleella pacifica]GGD02686.1 hypothetical protein GCM10011368_00590 [Hyunsoonleella pacifica]